MMSLDTFKEPLEESKKQIQKERRAKWRRRNVEIVREQNRRSRNKRLGKSV
jgi:hypothetical protein